MIRQTDDPDEGVSDRMARDPRSFLGRRGLAALAKAGENISNHRIVAIAEKIPNRGNTSLCAFVEDMSGEDFGA